MISHSVPMGYESLKTVLLHTDPNLRFKIAQRIPKICLTEKTVPLKIKSLSLYASTTVVNDQSYELGVYRHYHTEDIPYGIKHANNSGGITCDLDQYGFVIPNSFDPILNGDVSFRTENVANRRNDTEETERGYRFELRSLENALAKINQLELEGKTVEEFLAGPMTDHDQRIRFNVGLPKEDIQAGIDDYRNDLLPFHYRRNNLSPPYTCYIQLTITQEEDKITIQRYKYNHKLYEAVKKLNETLFANRPVIIVNKLRFGCSDVLRTPIGFKILANVVKGYDFQIASISSIVDSSRTLSELSIDVTGELVSNFQHSFVKNAKLLTIFTHKKIIDQLLRAFETLENQQIHIEFMDEQNPSANDYFQLLQGWMSTTRSIWSAITFELKTDQIGEEILEFVRTRNERTESTERFIIAQRIPKIQLTEKAVPLRIGSLSLEKCTTTVNSQSYKLGVYRHYHTEDIPRSVKQDNDKGGVSCDLDQYGFEIPNSSTPILNGDVSFRTENAANRRNDAEETERYYRFSLKRYKNYLAKTNYEESRGKTGFNKVVLQMKMDACRSKLLPFHYRRNNLSPPYTCYIQLTITQGNVTTIQRYEYNQKLYEAAKKLNERLFANRPVIIVHKFEHSCFDVLRMPVGFKMFAKLVCTYDNIIIPISSIVDSSRTLRELSVSVTSELVSNFQHSFVKNAEKLSIHTRTARIDQLARAFGTMENQHIHIQFGQFDNLSPNEYYQLLQGWLSIERSVRSMITIGLRTDQIGEDILELVRNGNEKTRSTDGWVTVLRSNATKLEVFYVPYNEEKDLSRFILAARIKRT
ncbi:hypothetical protein B9Z55_007028 [Caenorhabditis nigoni]|uniref:Uncharacterized protein n=1 Tax=Caenorhabditis nigoni TaxID=1611254 RepID=A0A2G5V7R1_9PELO|nr:hypothetical protein B9Z55_007028 [Caenorhabditis nigoni]